MGQHDHVWNVEINPKINKNGIKINKIKLKNPRKTTKSSNCLEIVNRKQNSNKISEKK